MVQCSSCTNWYHGECLNINVEDFMISEEKWICNECKQVLSAVRSRLYAKLFMTSLRVIAKLM